MKQAKSSKVRADLVGTGQREGTQGAPGSVFLVNIRGISVSPIIYIQLGTTPASSLRPGLGYKPVPVLCHI